MNFNQNLIIIGAGGHAKSVLEIASSLNYNFLGFLDDYSHDVNVIGKIQEIGNFKGYSFVLGIGGIKNLNQRNELIQSLKVYHASFINLISPYSVISKNVKMGNGNTIHPYVFVNTHVYLGNFCILNTRSTIEHDCEIGDNVHISTGVILNGGVKVKSHVFIGSGTVVKNQVEICENCIIGMGSVVLKNIQEPGIYVGNPLKRIKKF